MNRLQFGGIATFAAVPPYAGVPSPKGPDQVQRVAGVGLPLSSCELPGDGVS